MPPKKPGKPSDDEEAQIKVKMKVWFVLIQCHHGKDLWRTIYENSRQAKQNQSNQSPQREVIPIIPQGSGMGNQG
jgi:hypothetical protein